MNLLALYRKLSPWPLGRRLFSFIIAFYAPYFLTIRPHVLHLDERSIRVRLPKRWAVSNHIGTVHAIACCNLAEFCAGVLFEAALPRDRRWIPKSMRVDYLAKAGSDLVGVCEAPEVARGATGDATVTVNILDKNEKVVVRAEITMWVSERPKTA